MNGHIRFLDVTIFYAIPPSKPRIHQLTAEKSII